MQNRRWRLYVMAVLVVGALFASGTTLVYATSSNPSSPHYQASQLQFGSSDTNQNCSSQYCATAGVGGPAGNSLSASYVSSFGPVTGSEPLLEVIVEGGASDLGTLSSGQTSTKTIVVKVRNYLSSGYVVQLIGKAPTYNGYTLTSLTTPSTSSPGTEQFGVNAVTNTSPAVGANLVQVPSSQTSFGRVSANYATPNKFMYQSGDVIASSAKSSGETDYTISMIVNISNATPAGRYASDFSAVVIPAY